MRVVLGILMAIALGYLGLLAFIYLMQARLVYFPDMGREPIGTPRDIGLAYEEVWLQTADGERLHAWWVPHAAARGAVLMFHGNAGNISQRMGYIAMLNQLGYASLIFDYRGYGRSSGKPDEDGTYRDAEAAWRHLTAERQVDPQRVVLLAESLGGGVATWLALQHPPAALVLASCFTSVPDVGAEVYPWLPVHLLSRFHYDNRARMPQIAAPVFVAHSPQDEVIPFRHGRALFEAAHDPKTFLQLRGGHNEGLLYGDRAWVRALADFLDRHLPHAALQRR
jgi:uncharacterized protein